MGLGMGNLREDKGRFFIFKLTIKRQRNAQVFVGKEVVTMLMILVDLLVCTLMALSLQGPFTYSVASEDLGKKLIMSQTMAGLKNKESESEAAQSCPTLSDPMDCSLPGSSHGIFQARVLEWVAIAFSKIIKVLCN